MLWERKLTTEQTLLKEGEQLCPSISTQSCVSQVISLFGCIVLAVAAYKTYNSGMIGYAAVMFVLSVTTLINFIVYRIYGNWQLYLAYIGGAFSFLYMFLLASGGEENTGLLWCFAYPLVLFPLFGIRMGSIMMTTIMFCSAVILYFPEWVWTANTYTDNMRYRFTGAIIFISLISFMMERSRAVAKRDNDAAQEKLRRLAKSDDLTGLFNRRGVKEKVQLELHRVARDKTEMSLVLCDIDLFKRINDRYGHDVGDAALKHISKIIEDTIRVTDEVGRWGGEEFLIMLPNTTLLDGYQLIERVREHIAEQTFEVNGIELNLSISCGICSTQFCSRFEDLVKAADISLYEAKAQGRNCTRPALARVS